MSVFLAILLKILQIIGIFLLSILALLLLIIILILFVPVRYKAEGEYKEGDYKAIASGSWLMHIVSFSYSLIKGEEGLLKIKLFGFLLNGEKKKKKSKKNRQKKAIKTKEEKIDKNSLIPETSDGDDASSEEEIILLEEELEDNLDDNLDEISSNSFAESCDSLEEILIEDESETEEENEEESEIKSVEDSSEELEEEFKEVPNDESSESEFVGKNTKKHKKREKSSKDSKKYGKINEYLEILQSNEFKKAFELCKKQLAKLLKAVLPKHWYLNLDLAFSDPEKYGKVMGYYGMSFAWTYKHLDFVCIPDDDYINASGDISGRIYLITLLCVGIKVYFNKNIKKLLKMLKAEEG